MEPIISRRHLFLPTRVCFPSQTDSTPMILNFPLTPSNRPETSVSLSAPIQDSFSLSSRSLSEFDGSLHPLPNWKTIPPGYNYTRQWI